MKEKEVETMMELIGIKEVTSKRQKKNGTRIFKLPIKDAWGADIYVGSYESGYVRRVGCGGYIRHYQLNKCKPHIEYDKDWEYDEHGNHRYTGKYRRYVGKQRILILSEEDRLDYLLKYCIKNFYIAGANRVANGEFIPKWKHEWELEKKEKEFNGVRDVSITIDGARYKVI